MRRAVSPRSGRQRKSWTVSAADIDTDKVSWHVPSPRIACGRTPQHATRSGCQPDRHCGLLQRLRSGDRRGHRSPPRRLFAGFEMRSGFRRHRRCGLVGCGNRADRGTYATAPQYQPYRCLSAAFMRPGDPEKRARPSARWSRRAMPVLFPLALRAERRHYGGRRYAR